MNRQTIVFNFIDRLANKYNINLRDMHIKEIQKVLTKADWLNLSNIVKYGKELH